MSNDQPRHCVAVIGGAVAGAEVAGVLAERGVEVVVFEQNVRPFGKIEDGLPSWHVALRRKEYETIGDRLARPHVPVVPSTRIGEDVGFRELTESWGFSGVVLACGAWRDRPLPVDGADAYLGKGLVYQNPFIIWFNHRGDPRYHGPRFEPKDGALVVGGGLASIDVAKVLMLETTRAALAQRGIEVDLVEMEVKGIPKTLTAHGLTFEELGLEGCTLFYRREDADMPLMEMPEGATPERQEKVRAGRKRMLAKAMDKYRFHFEPLCMPDGLIVEDGRLAGLRFRRTRMEKGRPVPTDETFERRGVYVISSIGSIPEPIEGIPMKGELFAFTDWDIGRIGGYPTVFSAGNVVTGKGNVVASRKHAREVEQVVQGFLGIAESKGDGRGGEAKLLEEAAQRAAEHGRRVAEEVGARPPLDPETLEQIRDRVVARQKAVGYGGDYRAWIAEHGPAS